MNDPELDKPINDAEAQANDAITKQRDSENKIAKQNSPRERTRELLSPTRWWYASTAFPLIAGKSSLPCFPSMSTA